MELRKHVKELQEGKIPSTPPEVLEERKNTTSEAVGRIIQGEQLCTKAVEAVFAKWVLLLEDEAAENIREYMRQDELKIFSQRRHEEVVT